ncbi:hypothetical protein ACJX0J_005791, partial [Zea mays]
MYAAFDDLSSSRMVFDLHPVKDLHHIWKEAFEIFRLMHCVARSCVHVFEAWEIGLIKNNILWNSMISGYLVNNDQYMHMLADQSKVDVIQIGYRKNNISAKIFCRGSVYTAMQYNTAAKFSQADMIQEFHGNYKIGDMASQGLIWQMEVFQKKTFHYCYKLITRLGNKLYFSFGILYLFIYFISWQKIPWGIHIGFNTLVVLHTSIVSFVKSIVTQVQALTVLLPILNLVFTVFSSVSIKFVELWLEKMPDKKIEGADSSHIVSSTKSLESSVGPNLIESTDGDYCNNLHKTAVANFVASMLQEHPMSLILAENKSNLQEISVEQKIPIFVSINLSPKVDGSELPCPIEVHDGITSSSSKTNEPMEAQDYSNTMKSNTASCMFEASKRQECPISLILADKKGSLQEVSVEQNVPCGDYVALSQKADGSELTSTREAPEGFLTSSSKVYVLKEAQDGSITTEASKVNVCAASHSMLRLIEGVQDEASCIDSDKVTCETPPAILKKLKEDKPLVVHRFHKHQMSLGDTHQKVPAPVSRSNTSKYLRMDKNIVDTTTPIESVKAVASKFGGSMNWKTRKTQTAQ